MITFIKFIGAAIIMLGLILLMSAYDMTQISNLETFSLALVGILIIIIGIVCWIWNEPYNKKN